MLTAFVYNEVAVLVRHWFEIDLDDSHLEHGARIELRLLDDQPHRGTESAAQRIVADRPVWRADLFDRIDGVPAGFEAAHFHPYFDGVEPSRRHWAEQVKTAPWEWLHGQLSDIDAVITAGGRRWRTRRRRASGCAPTWTRSSPRRATEAPTGACPRTCATPGPATSTPTSASC